MNMKNNTNIKYKIKSKNKIKNLKQFFVTLPLALAISNTVFADQVILDDLIIDGSICAGMDCVNGESFGFDTIRLKENNLRIKFQDTSSSASFPTNDWQITVNDSANGGANKFSIDDIDGGRTPFTIEASAPSHSLYVDDGGRLGLGTNTPVVDVHVKGGNTPTLRLEQDGTSGFTPQTWDVAGNEAGFFVRDATNGSTLPFRIEPGAPSSAIHIDNNGNVGIGDSSPDAALDIENGDLLIKNGQLRVGIPILGEATIVQRGGQDVAIATTSPATVHNRTVLDTTDSNTVIEVIYNSAGTQQWVQSSRNDFSNSATANRMALYNANNSEVLTVHQNGSLFVGDSSSSTNNTTHAIDTASGAHLTAGGVWTDASSRELKQSISQIGLDAARAALMTLNPVTFQYKREPDETYAGFIAEDVPALVATNDRKSLAPMDIVAVLTTVLKDQQKTIQSLSEKVTKLEKNKD